MKPMRACGIPGCPELIPTGQTRCAKHKQQDNKTYEQHRDKAKKRKYSDPAWKALRERKLAKDPLCEPCMKEDGIVRQATIVHHKHEVEQGGAFLPPIDGLESVCFSHHNRHKRGAIKHKAAQNNEEQHHKTQENKGLNTNTPPGGAECPGGSGKATASQVHMNFREIRTGGYPEPPGTENQGNADKNEGEKS